MPPTESTFIDWQQVDKERPLLIDEDFSWSEPPARPRRRITGDMHRPGRADVRSNAVWDQPTQAHNHFDEMMAEWSRDYGDRPYADLGRDYDDRPDSQPAPGPRTVVITGRGDDRYVPPGRRRSRSSDLRFHERAGFTPDRTAMWAVLLGLVLLIACVAH